MIFMATEYDRNTQPTLTRRTFSRMGYVYITQYHYIVFRNDTKWLIYRPIPCFPEKEAYRF